MKPFGSNLKVKIWSWTRLCCSWGWSSKTCLSLRLRKSVLSLTKLVSKVTFTWYCVCCFSQGFFSDFDNTFVLFHQIGIILKKISQPWEHELHILRQWFWEKSFLKLINSNKLIQLIKVLVTSNFNKWKI